MARQIFVVALLFVATVGVVMATEAPSNSPKASPAPSSSPKAPTSSPKAPTSSPKAPTSSPKAPTSSPKAPASSPKASPPAPSSSSPIAEEEPSSPPAPGSVSIEFGGAPTPAPDSSMFADGPTGDVADASGAFALKASTVVVAAMAGFFAF